MLFSTRFLIFLFISTCVVVVKTTNHGNEDGASLRSLSQDDRRMAEEAGFSYVDRLTQIEEDLYAQGLHVKEGSPMSMMAKFKRPSQDVIELSRKNMRFIETVRYLKHDLGLKEEEIERNIGDGMLDSGCLKEIQCSEKRYYRTMDGSCNHPEHQLENLGRSVSGYRRLLQPAYDDGVSSPRSRAISGAQLPSSRLISMNVFSNGSRSLERFTSLLMQFGQFINHDMESTSTFTFSDGSGFACCAAGNMPLNPSILDSLVHCLPITIPVNDPQLQNGGEGCMNFVRSSTGPNRISCELKFVKHAEQFNQNTHWLDASTVYGSNNDAMKLIRNTSNGMLKTYINFFGHSLLPPLHNLTKIFRAGDLRVSEQPQLAVMHTIWMREHNRIATILTNLNPDWSSETVFQETRRIVIAELQHITYNEFLPNLFGFSGMQMNSMLRPFQNEKTFDVFETDKEDHAVDVDENHVNYYRKKTVFSGPISNEFAAAAFRMGHSLVQGNVEVMGTNNQTTQYNMRDFFNMIDLNYQSAFLDDTIRGLVHQPSLAVDTHITDDLRLHLFKSSPSGYGGNTNNGILDIVALNIQRGRDHGLPSYNSYREHCGLPKLEGPISSLPTTKPEILLDSTDPITPYFNPWVVNALSQVYESVDDIDLFVGGIAEINPLSDEGLLGPTFMCIIAETFEKLKFEDRYFYEAGKRTNPYPFSPNQLIEIKKSSMARILCDNNDGSVLAMQPNPFASISEKNPMVLCLDNDKIPSLNLTLWAV